MLRFIYVVFVLIQSCGGDTPKNNLQSIIGDDDRRVTRESYLELTIGKVTSPFGNCSAFISGPSELTTALHCVNMAHQSEVIFTTASGRVIPIVGQKKVFVQADIIVLEIPRQQSFLVQGVLGEAEPLTVVSAAQKTSKLLVNQCLATEKQQPLFDGIIFHACDTLPGASGSPILQDGKYVGVHVGTTTDHQINIAVAMNAITDVDLFAMVYEPERACGNHLRLYEIFLNEATHWAVASGIVMKVGMFFGPFGGLAGGIPAAVAAERKNRATKAKEAYDRCIVDVQHQAELLRQEKERNKTELENIRI